MPRAKKIKDNEFVELIVPTQRPSYRLKQKVKGKKIVRIRADRIDNKDYFVYTLEQMISPNGKITGKFKDAFKDIDDVFDWIEHWLQHPYSDVFWTEKDFDRKFDMVEDFLRKIEAE